MKIIPELDLKQVVLLTWLSFLLFYGDPDLHNAVVNFVVNMGNYYGGLQ